MIILSAYQMHLNRQPSEEELMHHVNSTVDTQLLNMHIRNSQEAKNVRNERAKRMRCCRG